VGTIGAKRRGMRALALLALSTTAIPACATDDVDEIVLEPGAGKEDGSTLSTVWLRPDSPEAKFKILCDEWFSCDLDLRLIGGADGVHVDILHRSSGEVTELVQREVSCLDKGTVTSELQLLPIDGHVAAGMPCLGPMPVRVHSSNSSEAFIIDVRKDEWDAYEAVAGFTLSADWH
jgi:hypothetical protein